MTVYVLERLAKDLLQICDSQYSYKIAESWKKEGNMDVRYTSYFNACLGNY